MKLQQTGSLDAAFLFAALAPAFVVGVVGSLAVIPLAFAIALVHAALLGLPLYFIFPKRWINVVTCTGAGFAVGAIPAGLLTLFSGSMSSSIDGVPTVINGTRTAAGWWWYFSGLGFFGLLCCSSAGS